MEKCVFIYLGCLLCIGTFALRAQQTIFHANFHRDKLFADWNLELQYPDSADVSVENGELTIASKGGATLWLKQVLKGDVVIEYDRKVCVDSGIYDRLSDFNQFWLAKETNGSDSLRRRDGTLDSYNDLLLFYAGIGGNYNSTTRFRKYDGTGNRILLAERNESIHLLKPNVYYHVKTVVRPSKNETLLFVDNQLLFRYRGAIEKHGYFGFRLTFSRQAIRNFKVYKLR